MEEPFIHQTRKIPEIEIEGNMFVVDVAFAELREKANPENFISLNDLDTDGEKYVFRFDPEFKNIDWDEHGENKLVYLDQMVKLDPDGVAAKYGIEKEKLPLIDAELHCDPVLLNRRLKEGKLPIINIMGQNYFVDLRIMELRSTDEFWKKIDLNNTDVTAADKYVFFYDLQNKEVVEIPHTITEEPKNVVVVELPHELWLDPIACARKYADNELHFIDLYPLQHNLQARVRPVSMTYLPELIKQNKQKKLEAMKVVAENMPSTKRKKGKRL